MSALSIRPYFDFARTKVIAQTIHDDAGSAMIQLEPDLRCRPLCHDCGSPAGTVHSKGYRRIIRDLSMADTKVWLQVGYRKIWCDQCSGTRVERLSFSDARKRITHRLARYVYELCKVMTVQDVARHLDLNPKTVKAVDKIFLEREFGHTDYTGLRILAIDEIAVRKGHHYMTVVLDYLSGRVVWMGKGRTKATLDEFFDQIPGPQKALIEAVAMDMHGPYIDRVGHHCPQAAIVFDFFHVVKGFSKVIDNVRRSEYRKADYQDRRVMKGNRYLLLKNAENLTSPQQERLKRLLELNQTLSSVYILKDQLKEIYTYGDRRRAKHALDAWCTMALQIDHPSVDAFVRRLRRYEYGILSHCEYPIGTGRLEGVNNKIKVLMRKAYGFHDPNYLALKVKQACPAKRTTNFLG